MQNLFRDTYENEQFCRNIFMQDSINNTYENERFYRNLIDSNMYHLQIAR